MPPPGGVSVPAFWEGSDIISNEQDLDESRGYGPKLVHQSVKPIDESGGALRLHGELSIRTKAGDFWKEGQCQLSAY